MSGIIWPNDLAAIYELHWRAVELAQTRNPNNKKRWLRHKESGVSVSVMRSYDTDADCFKFDIELLLDDAPVYKGNRYQHVNYNLELIRPAVDRLQRLLVLDDLGDIL